MFAPFSLLVVFLAVSHWCRAAEQKPFQPVTVNVDGVIFAYDEYEAKRDPRMLNLHRFACFYKSSVYSYFKNLVELNRCIFGFGIDPCDALVKFERFVAGNDHSVTNVFEERALIFKDDAKGVRYCMVLQFDQSPKVVGAILCVEFMRHVFPMAFAADYVTSRAGIVQLRV